MNFSNAYDNFVKSFTKHIPLLHKIIESSWNNIDLTQKENIIIQEYLLRKNVGIDFINTNFCSNIKMKNYEVKFSSIFVHQKPRIIRHSSSINVCEGDTPECELGDLSIVLCFLDSNKKPLITKSVIMQAKKEMRLDSVSQKCLYDSDEKFLMPQIVVKKSFISGNERTFPSYKQGRTKALKYFIIKNGINSTCINVPWGNITQPFGNLISGVIIGDEGLDFNITSSASDWNGIMNDLIQIGSGKVKSSTLRGAFLDEILNFFNFFFYYETFSIDNADGIGIPIILIIVRDIEYIDLDNEL